MRLDIYLTENGLVSSRTEAKSFISIGAVRVDGEIVTKPSYAVVGEPLIELDKSSKKYVSRGGLKLEAALDAFDISVEDLMAVDIGASSGGFTDCLLQRGARSVIALDSGTAQLTESIRRDKRVISLENFNARYMTPHDLSYVPDIAVMDVSFISATLIMPAVLEVLKPGGSFVCLIKPQFEVGRKNVGKGGIVKDEKIRLQAVNSVIDFARGLGFTPVAFIQSPIIGGDGNVEFLAHFKKES